MLVMLRAPSAAAPCRASSRCASHTWPTISATLRLRLKPCCAVEQKRAIHGAAHLARDAQRAAVRLGDVDRLDALHLVHAQHPLAGAVLRNAARSTISRNRDLGDLGQLRAKLLRQIGHRGEIRRAAPVDPLHQLPGAKRLRAEARGDERLEFRARQARVDSRVRRPLRLMLPFVPALR